MTAPPHEGDAAAVERAFKAWNAADVDAFVRAFHPDCEIVSYLAPASEPYRGRDGVRRWEHDIRESFGRFDVEVQEVSVAAHGVLVLAEIQLKGQASGVPLTQPAGFLIMLEDGLVRRLQGFGSHDDARAAAG